jgi:hypothetical protein
MVLAVVKIGKMCIVSKALCIQYAGAFHLSEISATKVRQDCLE